MSRIEAVSGIQRRRFGFSLVEPCNPFGRYPCMVMQRFKLKLVEVEAVQVTDATFDTSQPNIPGVRYDAAKRCAFVETSEGKSRADVGDWIVKSADGRLHVRSSDVFASLYEAVS